ncbi:MAG: archaeal proteasome endopeptidase complex subunit alpha [Candidatus Aenigmarchaeota archaeon]|nr:archaeal proteasome endopeptidase complex subunit alpha [Candidatus Aenigmarchaeota archaeon]
MRQMGYDRAIAVFSPEGRMYQVEYARKAVEKATTALGIAFATGIILMAGKTLQKMLVPESVEKVSKVDDHIGIASCGILADSRVLVDTARVRAQVNKITYEEPIEIYSLAKDLADRIQRLTQIGGLRPYGVGLLIAGINSQPRLFETDPSGTLREWHAHAIGRGSKEARKVLAEGYKEGLAKEKAMEIGVKALLTAEKKLTASSTEIAVIEPKFNSLTRNEVRDILKKYAA